MAEQSESAEKDKKSSEFTNFLKESGGKKKMTIKKSEFIVSESFRIRSLIIRRWI